MIVRVNREKLVAALKRVRKIKEAEYQKAKRRFPKVIEAYRGRVVREMDEKLNRLRRAKTVNEIKKIAGYASVAPEEPSLSVAAIDSAIKRLELSDAETVNMSDGDWMIKLL